MRVSMDVARAAVIAGDGVVARFPGVVCVARSPDRAAVLRLLDVCAAAAGPDPGRGLARRLARWMGGADAPGDDLVFGTVAATGDRLGVFLVGATSVAIPGNPDTLSGIDAATWTDRIIPRPEAPVVLALDGAVPPSGLAGSPNDLRAGVVPGAGAVLFTGPDAVVDPLGDQARDEYERPGAGAPDRSSLLWPDPSPTAGNGATGYDVRAAVRTPLSSDPGATNGHAPGSGVALGGRHAILEPHAAGRDPEVTGAARSLDGSPEPGPSGPSTQRDGPAAASVPAAEERVILDDPLFGPSTAFAGSTAFPEAEPAPPTPVDAVPPVPPPPPRPATSGRSDEAVENPVAGARQPLGRIVFDDGATVTVDAPLLVGRMPEVDLRARSGELRAIVVADASGSVSRVHAEILIRGWDVVLVDSASRNGTFVAGPEETDWTALDPGATRRLVPGTRVRMGRRTFVFERSSSPH